MLSTSGLTYIDEVEHNELPIVFHLHEQEISPSFSLEKTDFIIEYQVTNGHDYSIKEIVLLVDTYLDDVFVDTITITIPVEVRHHRYAGYDLYDYYESFELFYFDDIEIVSFEIVEASFLVSYEQTIFYAAFYAFVVFAMWMFIDLYKRLTSFEVKEILKEYWWAVIAIAIFIPALFSVLSYVGWYHVLTGIYGWIFVIVASITLLFFYIVLRIYHAIRDRI